MMPDSKTTSGCTSNTHTYIMRCDHAPAQRCAIINDKTRSQEFGVHLVQALAGSSMWVVLQMRVRHPEKGP